MNLSLLKTKKIQESLRSKLNPTINSLRPCIHKVFKNIQFKARGFIAVNFPQGLANSTLPRPRGIWKLTAVPRFTELQWRNLKRGLGGREGWDLFPVRVGDSKIHSLFCSYSHGSRCRWILCCIRRWIFRPLGSCTSREDHRHWKRCSEPLQVCCWRPLPRCSCQLLQKNKDQREDCPCNLIP